MRDFFHHPKFRRLVLLLFLCLPAAWFYGVPKKDSDADGSPDALEYFLGTDSQNKQSVFAIKELARLESPARTRLQWPSVLGKSYEIQGSTSLSAPSWQTVDTVVGTGNVMVYDVPIVAGQGARFFQLICDLDTALPPWVGTIEADGGSVTQAGLTSLRLQVWHPLGVDTVIFKRGSRVLGTASMVDADTWELEWAVDVADNGTDPIVAEAHRGNTMAQTQEFALEVNIALPPQPAYLTQNLDQFVLLDAQGKPRAGSLVRSDADGNLPPCEFRPTGFNINGNLSAVGIRMPLGGKITGAPGSEVLEFNQSQLISGLKSPVKIVGNLTTTGPKTLALGAVQVSTLAALYGLPPQDGLPVSLLGQFEAVLETGTFTKDGLKAPRFALAEGTLPFGDALGGFEGMTLELGDNGAIYLPIAGTFPLKQAGVPDATLTVGLEQPAWVRLGMDKSLRLKGKGKLAFNNGPEFEVGLTLDDPQFGFEFRAGKLHAATTGAWLRPKLPSAETVNAGTTADVPTLNSAARLLSTKSRVFDRYAASFKASPGDNAPRGDAGDGTTPMEVIGLSKVAGATGLNGSDAELKSALDHAARSGAAARSAAGSARIWLDLERLRLGGLTSAELTAARDESRAALKRNLEVAGTPLSIAETQQVMQSLLERWQIAQQLNVAFDHDGLQETLETTIGSAIAAFAASVGVNDGVFSSPSPALSTRNRFVIYQDLFSLSELKKNAQLLGLNIADSSLLPETLAQLGLRLESVLRAELLAAEQANDEMAFRDALAEYLFLHKEQQLGTFAGASLPLLSVDNLSLRCGIMAQAVANQPRPLRPVAKRFHEVDRLGKILDSVPTNVSFPAPPVQRAYDGLQDSLSPAFSFLGTATREELLNILLAGNAGARVRDRMAFAAGSPAWENATRLTAVVDALAAKCQAQDDSTTAFKGAVSLFEFADRLTQPADQTRRKQYLIEAQKLVSAIRVIGLAREAAAPPTTVDAILAGGVSIDSVAGGLNYNTKSKELDGWASGQLRFPGMGASFTLTDASFSTGGAFFLNAHGSVVLPRAGGGANDQTARFSVTPRRPFTLGYSPAQGLSLSGGGKLEVNGMTYEAWLFLDDPNYRFGASFSGLNFDLANSLKVMVPTWPLAQRYPRMVTQDINAYFTDMASSIEQLHAGLSATPPPRKIGEVPDFKPPLDIHPFATLSAWASAEISDAARNVERSYAATNATVIEDLEAMKKRLTPPPSPPEPEPPVDPKATLALEEAAAGIEVLGRIEKAIEFKKTKTPPEDTTELEAKLEEVRDQERAYLIALFNNPDRQPIEVESVMFKLMLDKMTRTENGQGFNLAPQWQPVMAAALAYHKRTFGDGLSDAGLNPASGSIAGDGSVIKNLHEEELMMHLHAMYSRKVIATVAASDEATHTPGGSTQVLADRAMLMLCLQYRERLVREAWDLQANVPEWTQGLPYANVYVTPEEGRNIYNYALKARELSVKWTEFELMFTTSGLQGLVGNEPVLGFTSRVYGSHQPSDDDAVRSAGIDALAAAEAQRGTPLTTKMGVIPGTSIERMLKSYPVMEGTHGLKRPYGSFTPEERRRISALGIGRRSIDEETPEVQGLWNVYQLKLMGILPEAEPVPAPVVMDLKEKLKFELDTYVATPLAERSVAEGLDLANKYRTIKLMAEHSGAPELQAGIEIDFSALDQAFKAAVVAQKAWWYLSEYTDLLLRGANAKINGDLTASAQFFGDTASDSALTAMHLLQDMILLIPSVRPVDIALPGDLRIDHVYGEVRYNRDTGLLGGTFGGSLTFPNIATNFTLTSLILDNAGNISIQASASGPLPLLDGVRMNGNLSLAGQFGLGIEGQPPVVLDEFEASGSGTVFLPDGESFNGTFAYNTGTRIFEVTTSGNNLDLELGDHFVLLSGNAGLRFGGVGVGSYPSSGQFDFGGTFGLLRKESPATGPLTPDHFHLAAVDALARLIITPDSITVSLAEGKLLLPEAFQSPPVPPETEPARAELAINEAQPPSIEFTLGAADVNGLKPLELVTFNGAITFANLGLMIPDFEDVGARDFAGSFNFGSLELDPVGEITVAQAPKLTINTGIVFFPHPVDQNRIEIEAVNIQWKLDGFPTGTLRLTEDINIFDCGEFKLDVVGAPGVDTTGIEMMPPGPGEPLPALRIFGQLRGVVDNSILTREATNPVIEGIPSGKFGAIAGGELTIHAPVGNALPVVDFALSDVGITGDFRIGGANGVKVTGLTAGNPASIILSGLGNLFNLADEPGRQFVVTLNGKIVQEGLPGFGLGNAKFVFFSPTQPPRFVPDTLIYDGSSWDLAQQLPVELRSATLRFLNNTLPIEQMLQPQNIEITSTFRIGFPNIDEAIFGGGADDVRVTFQADGTPQVQNLEGIELTLDPGLSIPPIEELGGSVYLTGFSNPANLLMAGRIGGSMNGYKLKFIGAFRATGPLGLAVDFNAGSAGIPLGPTGFLFTGAGGGISFLNTSADPMDIKSYVQEVAGKFEANPTNPPPAATMNWEGFKDLRDEIIAQTPTFPPIGTGPPLEAIAPGTYPANDPIGSPIDIPPASANIFGMPHPDQAMFPGAYILKFSSIPEDTLNKPVENGGMGITRDGITDLGLSGQALALALASEIREQIDAQTPDVPPVLGAGAQQAAQDFLDELETGFGILFTQALQGLPVNATADQIYEAIRDKAYAGVTVQDATVRVKGVFTHSAISAFMNIEGGGTIGTTGSAGVTGQVNFLGVPVGTAKLFLSATDVNGNPNPQLTGDISMALGPLEIGSTKGALKAEGAMTGIAAVVLQIANTLGPVVTEQILVRVNPDFVGMSLAQAQDAVVAGVPVSQQLNSLLTFYSAFMGQVFQEPPGTLPDELIGQIASLFDQVNPELVIVSDAAIKFAGLKLSNGLVNWAFRMRKTGREAYFTIAPAGFIGYGTPIAALTSGIDRASIAYAETFPDATGLLKRLLNGKISSPAAIEAEARQQIADMLENSTMTGSYEVSPLGMNLFRASVRMINPDLTAHPVVRNNNASPTDNWVRPGTGVLNELPTREQLLLQAVRKDALANVFWKGTGNSLNELFGDKIPALNGKTLTHDYFPHGGLAMAAMLDVPRIFTSIPKNELATLANGAAEPLLRLEAMRTIMRDYFGTTTQQGNFMAYMPLPNPPALFQANGTPILPPPSLDPLDLANSLKTFNPDLPYPGSMWDIGEGFVYLNLNGQILDIPIGEVNLTAVGPNISTGAPAMFSGDVHFEEGSWAALLYGPVNVTASVTAQARPVRRTLAEAFAALEALDTFGPTPNETELKDAIDDLAAATADVIAQDLPRVELVADISTITPPVEWGWANEIVPSGSFTLSAYSPEFLPTLPPTPTHLQRLQKTGGIAMEGAFKLGNMVNVNGQVLVEPPTDARPRPRAIANLTGQNLTLPAPFGAVANASVQFDTESSTFITVNGTLQSSVDLSSQLGWPVVINANASVSISNHIATITFNNGLGSATVTANYTNPLVPTFSFSGNLEFPGFSTDVISIGSQGGGNLQVTVDGSTATLTNARVTIGGLFNKSANLPALTVDSSLNFSPTSIAAPFSSTLQGFSVSGLTWKVARTGGVLSITDVACNVTTTALGAGVITPISATTIASNGSYTLTGLTDDIGTLVNLPVSALATGAALTFNGTTAVITNGTVSGGLLATSLINGVTSMTGVTLGIGTSSVSSINGSIAVAAARLGGIEIRPTSGTFPLTLGMSGITVPAGNLFFTPVNGSVAIASIGSVTIPNLNAALPATVLNQTTGIFANFGGYDLSGMTFHLQRTSSSPLTYRINNVAFTSSLASGFNIGSLSVSGGFFDGQSSAFSCPVVSLPSLVAGRFSITNASGTPALTGAGLSLPQPRLSCSDLGISNVTIPGAPLVVPKNGVFSTGSISTGTISPVFGSLNGFSLSSASFAFTKTLSSASLSSFSATMPVPGFTAPAFGVNGTVGSSGSINLAGNPISQLAVNKIILKGSGGGNLTSTFSSSTGLRFVAGQFDVTDLLTGPSNFSGLVNLTVPASAVSDTTFLNFTASPNLRGYALGSSSITLERVSGAVRLSVSGALQLPAGPNLTTLSGTISSSGSVSLDASLNNSDFYGFPVTASFTLGTNPLPWSVYVSNSGALAWWKMDDTTGTALASTNSTYNGATTSTATRPALLQASGFRDGSGTAMLFDGVDDFYSVADNAALEGGNAMSVSCWFKVNQFTGGKSFHTLVAKGDNSWRIAQDGTANYLSFDTNSTISGHALRASTVAVNDGKWHHVVATYDGSMKRIYIDGVLRAAEAWTGPIQDSTYPVGIGYNPQAANRNWNGWMDEVAFWNVAIDAGTVHALYNRWNGLELAFSGQANLRGNGGAIAQEFRPEFSGSITSSGEFALNTSNNSATLLGFGFSDIDLDFRRSLLPSSTATINGAATLNILPGTPLATNPRFNASFTRSGGNTVASLNVNNITTNFGGYAPAAGGFDLAFTGNLGVVTPITFSDFRFGNATLAGLGLPPLTGTLLETGTFQLNAPILDSITLSGFTAPSCTIGFTNSGLTASGSFNLNITSGGYTRSFGSVNLAGVLNANGSYTFTGNGSIQIGAYSTNSVGLSLSSSTGRITPTVTPTLNFGELLNQPVTGLSLGSTVFQATMTRPFNFNAVSHLGGQLETKFYGNTTLSYSFPNGSLSGNLSGTWEWKVVSFDLPFGWEGLDLEDSFTINYGIGDNGDFTVNNTTADGNHFYAPFWPNGSFIFTPPPGWGWGSWSSEGYSLW